MCFDANIENPSRLRVLPMLHEPASCPLSDLPLYKQMRPVLREASDVK